MELRQTWLLGGAHDVSRPWVLCQSSIHCRLCLEGYYAIPTVVGFEQSLLGGGLPTFQSFGYHLPLARCLFQNRHILRRRLRLC
jgi:hypothetical protein